MNRSVNNLLSPGACCLSRNIARPMLGLRRGCVNLCKLDDDDDDDEDDFATLGSGVATMF